MITITLNTPLPTDTGEMISSCVVLLNNYIVREDINELNGTATIEMYRTIENAVDRYRPIWLLEVPRNLASIKTALTSNQYANVDMGQVQNALANILEVGDSAGIWDPAWGSWDGLKGVDPLNTAVKTMPTPPDVTPTGFSATLNNGAADLVWVETASNEFGFVIERSLTSGSDFVEIARVKYNVESYTDDTISPNDPGIEFFYRVAAWNNAGLSDYTPEDSVITV